MQKRLRTSVICFIAAVASFAVLIPVAPAQIYMPAQHPVYVKQPGHAGTWDFLTSVSYGFSSDWKGPAGSSVHLEGGWGLGLGLGYNLTDHFQLNGLLTWDSRRYAATVINTDNAEWLYRDSLDTADFTLNGVYYLATGCIRPFLSAGAGLAYLNTHALTVPASSICRWDPWLGYMCAYSPPDKTESGLTYNIGAGLRLNINRELGLQASYNKTWIDIRRAASTPDFDVWRLDFIYQTP